MLRILANLTICRIEARRTYTKITFLIFQNADQVERLNEMGELRKMLKSFKVTESSVWLQFWWFIILIIYFFFSFVFSLHTIILTSSLIIVEFHQCIDSVKTCLVCGGYNMLPCPSCGGSKKSVHRNHFTAEFIALKCMNCDEVGLVRCYNCS